MLNNAARDIAVVIPVHNRRVQLMRAVNSVLAQELPAQQIIIVDDGSDDNPAELIQARFGDYEHITVVVTANGGVSRARNVGIEQARCQWVAFLDSDDEWLPGKLRHQAQCVSQASSSRICHTDEIWVRNGTRVNQMTKHTKQGGRIFSNCLPLCAMSPSSVMIHRQVFETVGLFDDRLPACEDYDLWLRVCAHFDVDFVDQPLVRKYGGHADQLSSRFWGMDRFRVQALQQLIDNEFYWSALTTAEQQLTVSMLQKKLTVLINGARKRDHHPNLTGWQTQLSALEIQGEDLAGEPT